MAAQGSGDRGSMGISLPEGWRKEASRLALLRTTNCEVLVPEQRTLGLVDLRKPRVARLGQLLQDHTDSEHPV